jgi:hypothetical protein
LFLQCKDDLRFLRGITLADNYIKGSKIRNAENNFIPCMQKEEIIPIFYKRDQEGKKLMGEPSPSAARHPARIAASRELV